MGTTGPSPNSHKWASAGSTEDALSDRSDEKSRQPFAESACQVTLRTGFLSATQVQLHLQASAHWWAMQGTREKQDHRHHLEAATPREGKRGNARAGGKNSSIRMRRKPEASFFGDILTLLRAQEVFGLA